LAVAPKKGAAPFVVAIPLNSQHRFLEEVKTQFQECARRAQVS
jgi:hypothetical protein